MTNPGVVFIYTNSFDYTSDLLISRLGSESAFRFNSDTWQDYRILAEPGNFRIAAPNGREVTRGDVAKFYWRKPLKKHLIPGLGQQVSSEEKFCEEEIWYAMREVVNMLWQDQKLVLVEPFGDARVGKLIQAEAAAKYFDVPPSRFVLGRADALRQDREAVVKSLTSQRVEDDTILYATRVKENELNPAYPWMIQDLVEAEMDVTVVFVRDRMFAFELRRAPFLERTLDWKEISTEAMTDDWPVHQLPANIEEGIRGYMQELNLQYGRLDFLRTTEGRYYFLEVNPNGEWGWLDSEGKYGLLDKILEEVTPTSALHPLPKRYS
jgi:hypothetical protein